MSATTYKALAASPAVPARRRTWLTAGCLAAGDIVAVAIAAWLAYLLSRGGHPASRLAEQAAAVCSALLAFAAFGLYPLVGMNPAQEFQRVLAGTSMVAGVVAFTRALEGKLGLFAILQLAAAWVLTFALVMVCRTLLREACSHKPWWGVPTVIFGSHGNARPILDLLQRNPSLGLKVAAVFDDAPSAWTELTAAGVPFGSVEHGLEFAGNAGIEHAIVATDGLAGGSDLPKLLRYHAHGFKHLLVVPNLPHITSLWAEPRDIGGVLALHVSQPLRQPLPRLLKRGIDVAICCAAGIVALPFFLAAWLAVRLSSPGPVFYSQSRVGRNSSRIRVWKFRTMYRDADQVLSRYLDEHPELRRQWESDRKLKNDPRVTPAGRLLRKLSVDELPQLWNVLTGDMSLVGPRPIVPAEIVRYGEHFQAYASVRPGITGLWQISGRNNTSYGERVEYDEYYVRNWSICLDLYIISRTVKTVLLGEGAY